MREVDPALFVAVGVLATTLVEVVTMTRVKDITGRVYGKLTVVRFAKCVNYQAFWECRCECGEATVVRGDNLRGGTTRSCGCLQRTRTNGQAAARGKTGTKEYHAWYAMHNRCANPKVKGYKDWGGRGIKVCERWRDFGAFIEDMGPAPQGLTLDRIDNDGDYEPGNCRWATWSEQLNNTQRTIRVPYRGGTKTVREIAEMGGMSRATVYQRLKHGWTADRIVATPPSIKFRPKRG